VSPEPDTVKDPREGSAPKGDPPPQRKRYTMPKASAEAKAKPEPLSAAEKDKAVKAVRKGIMGLAEVSGKLEYDFGVVHFQRAADDSAKAIVAALDDWPEGKAWLKKAGGMVSGKWLLAGTLVTLLAPPILYAAKVESVAYMMSPVDPMEVMALEYVRKQLTPEQREHVRNLPEDQRVDMVMRYAAENSQYSGHPSPEDAAPTATAQPD
jgi:hypothetical protein